MMNRLSLFLVMIIMSGCGTVQTGSRMAKGAVATTGKVAVGSGRMMYKGAKATGDAVAHVTKTSAKAVSDDIADTVDGVTTAPPADHVDSVAQKPSVGEAMLTPLSDVNIRQQEIPAILTALTSPYEPVMDESCTGLAIAIHDLDVVLGPDMDVEEAGGDQASSKGFVARHSVKAVEKGVSSFIPYRWAVRAASGATAYDDKVRREYRKGVARRSYLRGLYVAGDCNDGIVDTVEAANATSFMNETYKQP